MRAPLILAVLIPIACGREEKPPPSPSVIPALAAVVTVQKYDEARKKTAEVNAQQIMQAAMLHLVQHASCPADVDALVRSQSLGRELRDPWDRPFTIDCRDGGEGLRVSS